MKTNYKYKSKIDYIITKRALINLANFNQQVCFRKLSKTLNKNGKILCCEKFSQDLEILILREKT